MNKTAAAAKLAPCARRARAQQTPSRSLKVQAGGGMMTWTPIKNKCASARLSHLHLRRSAASCRCAVQRSRMSFSYAIYCLCSMLLLLYAMQG